MNIEYLFVQDYRPRLMELGISLDDSVHVSIARIATQRFNSVRFASKCLYSAHIAMTKNDVLDRIWFDSVNTYILTIDSISNFMISCIREISFFDIEGFSGYYPIEIFLSISYSKPIIHGDFASKVYEIANASIQDVDLMKKTIMDVLCKIVKPDII